MDNMTGHKESRSPGLLTVFHLDLPRMNRVQDGADDRGELKPCNRTIASGQYDNCGCQAFRYAPKHHLEAVDAIWNDRINT